jgi:hypothetical protein
MKGVCNGEIKGLRMKVRVRDSVMVRIKVLDSRLGMIVLDSV